MLPVIFDLDLDDAIMENANVLDGEVENIKRSAEYAKVANEVEDAEFGLDDGGGGLR